MELYCPKCGEPWDNDTFHEAAEEQDATYAEVTARFRRDGCSAIGWGTCRAQADSGCDSTFGLTRAEAAAAMYDMLGDDMDAIAAELSDLFG